MVTFTNNVIDFSESYDEIETFERIRSRRENPMPVGRNRSAIKAQKQSRSPRRARKVSHHSRGATHRRVRRWL